MEYKKSMIILILAIFLLSIASVSASDADDATIVSENNLEIDQTTDDVIGAAEDTDLASSEENEILSADEQTFAKLNATINGNTDNDIYLNGNYKYSSGEDSFKDGIVINRDVNIYGNGATINGSNEARIFQIYGGNVVFYNITFVNGNAGDEWESTGGAINGNCKAINCNFTANHAKFGGAMMYGSAVNCSFSENNATESGGAMMYGSAVNCSFSRNTASTGDGGGAMMYGSAVNCTFTENAAIDYYGGAMFGGSAVNCSFSGNTARGGGAMYKCYNMSCTGQDPEDYYRTQNLVFHWDANNFTAFYGSADKLPIQLMNQENKLIDFINYDVVIYKDGSKVKTYHCLSNVGPSIDLPIGVYTAELVVTYPGIDKPEPKNITITVNYATFADLNKTINGNTKEVITLDKNYAFNSTFDSDFIDGIVINRQVTINGNGYTIDAKGKARVFNVQAEDVTIENLTIKNANSTGKGGAIYFEQSGSVINCNFTNNSAYSDGGAVFFYSYSDYSIVLIAFGSVTNCNFVNNTASWSGAISMGSGTVTNCSFVNNSADNSYGAISMGSGTVTNCNFTGNEAYNSGAIHMNFGSVTNCNFICNNATYYGGAIYMDFGSVTNCNFICNNATYYGGAVCFSREGNVTNCNFTDNHASGGGAVRMESGTVENCNFTNNSAYSDGGAVYFMLGGNVTNCNFICNNATYYGGAVCFWNDMEETMRNIGYSDWEINDFEFHIHHGVINCNFTGNNATAGSAIYFYSTLDTKNVSNSCFLNNRANAEALDVVKNDNNITITFTGQNNLLNAIYSNGDVTFTNVAYWGANGIANTGSSPTTPSRSNKATGQNITVGVVVNDAIVLNEVKVTDENGTIVLDMKVDGDYLIRVCHNLDSYYTQAETILSNMTFNVNVTSQTTTNKTVNITAKSNIYNEVMPGKLLFILPNGTEINATYAAGGIWWAVHTFEGYGVYQVNASYDGLNNVTVNKGTIAVTAPEHTFWFLNYTINGNDKAEINLTNDYYYDSAYDEAFAEGIIINRKVTINGNGHTIDAKGKARVFNVQAGDVTIKNLTIKNANYNGDGGAVLFKKSGSVINCNFANNNASTEGGAVYFKNYGNVTNCNFTGNTATVSGGAVYFKSNGEVTNCNFTDNTADVGGAVYFDSDGNVTNCNFADNTADVGGAVYFQSTGTVANCNFTNNSARYGGAVYFQNIGSVSNCNFTDNTADVGGAVYFDSDGNVTNCNFAGNTADYGGAIIIDSGNVSNCNFTNNTATNADGGAIWMYSGSVENCNFTGNTATAGSAIYFWSTLYTKTVSNSRFLNNRANAETLEVIKNDNNITITFAGQNNLLNAIFSNTEVTFNNVTYWGKNGITTISTTKSGFNKEEGQNITVGVVVNDKLVLSEVMVTDENGQIVLDISAGDNYYIGVHHDTDSYYTEAEKTISNMTFTVNITSQTTTNKTVNITAKSNIYSEVMPGKLLFILPNGDEINATYAADGIWWAEHTFEDYGDYQINASYVGLGNVTVNNATISISKANSTVNLSSVVMYYGESTNVTVAAEGATGITAKINNADVSVVNNYTIPISGLDAGNYTLKVTTIPDEDHNPASKAVNITVNKAPTEITVASPTGEMSAGAMAHAAAELNPSKAGNLTYTSNDTSVVNVSSTGIIRANGAGTALITVSFAGSDNYAAAENRTIKITVNLNDASVSVNNATLDLFAGDNFTIVATTNPAGLNVSFVPDNSGVCSVDENGTVTALKEGTGKIIVKVGDGKVYAENSTIVAVTVSKIPTEIIVQNATIDMRVGDEADLDTSLMPSGAGELDYTSSDVSVVVVNGIGTITAVGEGIANVTVRFTGNDKYAACESKNITVTVTKTATEIAADPVTATYNVNKNLVITLKDANGNPLSGKNITVMLNGAKNYTTDENGSVNVSTKGLAPGVYAAEITFNGTNAYAKSAGKVNVIVKKAAAKITAKAKTFKTTTKTKKYTITLKNNIKKPIKKATVYLKVGGKTYKATTNSKGKATFKITKLAKKGTYKATVTYKATKYYNKATKKVKITVKAGFKTVSKGSKDSKTVKKIQIALKNNGYYLSAYGHYLKIDGVYHGHTEAAVKQFQKDNGLKVTGKVDEKTAKKLKII